MLSFVTFQFLNKIEKGELERCAEKYKVSLQEVEAVVDTMSI